jgi:hypothetical protein
MRGEGEGGQGWEEEVRRRQGEPLKDREGSDLGNKGGKAE